MLKILTPTKRLAPLKTERRTLSREDASAHADALLLSVEGERAQEEVENAIAESENRIPDFDATFVADSRTGNLVAQQHSGPTSARAAARDGAAAGGAASAGKNLGENLGEVHDELFDVQESSEFLPQDVDLAQGKSEREILRRAAGWGRGTGSSSTNSSGGGRKVEEAGGKVEMKRETRLKSVFSAWVNAGSKASTTSAIIENSESGEGQAESTTSTGKVNPFAARSSTTGEFARSASGATSSTGPSTSGGNRNPFLQKASGTTAQNTTSDRSAPASAFNISGGGRSAPSSSQNNPFLSKIRGKKEESSTSSSPSAKKEESTSISRTASGSAEDRAASGNSEGAFDWQPKGEVIGYVAKRQFGQFPKGDGGTTIVPPMEGNSSRTSAGHDDRREESANPTAGESPTGTAAVPLAFQKRRR